MKIDILTTPDFDRSYKRLFKKHRSLKSDLLVLYETLLQNPYAGDRIGENVYKIRLAIKSKGKGKSGGARIFTHVELRVVDKEETTEVILLDIIDKSELATLSSKDVEGIIGGYRKTEEE